MSFPDDPLDILIEIALDNPDRQTDPSGWTWEDISEYGREAQRIVISEGDADEFGDTPPATCALTLDNTDGRFTRRNPHGVYYGRLGRNTPIRISVDAGSGYEVRFFGEVASWPKRWDRSGNDSTVPISCSGISRRLGQNDAEVKSALTGYLSSTAPVAWWPLDDGEDSTSARSGLTGGLPMVVRRGVMDFADDAPPGASGSAHPDPSAFNALVGAVSGASASGWQVSIWTKGTVASDAVGTVYYIPCEVRTSSGQIFRLVMQYDSDLAIGVGQYSSESQEIESHSVVLSDSAEPRVSPGITGEWILVQFTAEQNGANIDAALYVDGVLVDSDTWNGLTLGAPIRVNCIGGFAGPTGVISNGTSEIYLAQLAIHDGASLVPQYEAGLGFPGEPAADRILRLCAAENVPCAIQGSVDTELMGPQPAGSLVPLLRECETVDGGTLQDDPTGPGLLYIPRAERYNLDPWVLDYTDGDIGAEPEATDDDRDVVNRVVMTRTGGGSATVQDDDAIAENGGIVITDSQTRNVWQDTQLPDQAGWRLRQGTLDEDRWPKISLNFARRPELIEDWYTITPGVARVQVVNFPDQIGPGPIDVIVEGWTETISTFEWTVDMFCSPASPWTVGVVEDEVLGRAGTDGSMLAADVDAGTDTSAVVSVTDGPLWITTAGQSAMFPFDIRSGGVVLEVTGIAASPPVLNSNPYFESTASPWTTPDATVARSTAQAHQGSASLLLTPTGAAAAARAESEQVAVVAGRSYRHAVWVRCAASRNVEVNIVWWTAGGSFISISSTAVAVTANTWAQLDATYTAPATAGLAAAQVRLTGTPSASHLTYIDEAELTDVGQQTFTITATPVNGVERTIPAGSPVSLADPMRLAL